MRLFASPRALLCILFLAAPLCWAAQPEDSGAQVQAGRAKEAKAAPSAESEKLYRQGMAQINGKSGATNYLEAAKYFRAAAELGHSTAQFSLAVYLEKGTGVKQDVAEALKWYQRAADQGNSAAQFNLGLKYSRGEAVPQDEVTAAKWFNLAAAKGHAKAQLVLGRMYNAGLGVKKDPALAEKLIREAAAQGLEQAKLELAKLEGVKTGETTNPQKDAGLESGGLITPGQDVRSSANKAPAATSPPPVTAAKAPAPTTRSSAPETAAAVPVAAKATASTPPATATPVAPPATSAAKSAATAPAEPSAEFANLRKGNFITFGLNGAYAVSTPDGEKTFSLKVGGYDRWGVPIAWSGDEFYYSGPRSEYYNKVSDWTVYPGAYRLWGKISPDGTALQSLRFILQQENGSEVAFELRDLEIKRTTVTGLPPWMTWAYYIIQSPLYADSAELFHTMVKIRDIKKFIQHNETLVEFRPHNYYVTFFRAPDLPAVSAGSLTDIRRATSDFFQAGGNWARLREITDEKLMAMWPDQVNRRLAGGLLEIQTDPAGKKELLADGHDTITVKARVKPKTGQPTVAQQAATKSIVFSGEGEGANWLDFGKNEPQLVDGWKTVLVQASMPNSVRDGAAKPPAAFTVRAVAQDKGKPLMQQIQIAVATNPEIDAKPDLVEFAAQSGQTIKVRVAIANAGPDSWEFRTEFEKKSRPLATVTVRRLDGKSAELSLKEAGLEPHSDGTSDERAVLRIIARQNNRPELERDIKIAVGQEGLFVSATGRDPDGNLFRLRGDGSGRPTEIDFRVFAVDPATKKMVNLTRREDVLKNMTVECLELKGSMAANVLEVGQCQPKFAGLRSLNEPAGILRLALTREVPGDGRIIPCDFRITYNGRDEEAFSAIVTVGVVTTKDGPGSTDWQVELARCQEIINKFVPAAYYPKMQAMLDQRKMTLGAQGLHLLRQKIWSAAAELTLGEGGSGYANEAAWAGAITETLEWAQWAGDMAFGVVIGTWTGPYGAIGADSLKGAVISALNAYQEGRGADEWLWENLSTIPGILEGQIVDVDTFEKMGASSKAKAWAIYIGYQFCKNLYGGASVVEALTNIGKDVAGNHVSGWLSEKVKKSAGQGMVVAGKKRGNEEADGKKVTGEETTAKGAAPATPAEANAAQRIRSRMSIQGGKPYANRDDVLAAMRDPSMVRALKNARPEVQEAFSNTREALYRQHDDAVAQHVKETVPGMQDRVVRVLEFRTPGATGPSLNTDRDYRVCYYKCDPKTGKGQWIEVDRRKWEDKSYETFASLTGGPKGTAAEAKHWAEEHQQLATDKYHPEASPDFSDQKKIWNPQTRKFESVQVESNILRVKAGQPGVSLQDPQALGHMYQVKVGDARFPHEKFVQAQKAVKELDAIRQGYSDQQRKIGQLPAKMRAGMEAVIAVNKKLAADPNRRDPKAIAEAERTLRENGFQDLGDFMNKLSSQFESLKTM